jgi:hypothetical protein
MTKLWAALAGAACAALALPAVAASRAPVALELLSTRRTILVDEPLVVTLLQSSAADVPFGDERRAPYLVIESEGQSRRYRPKPFVSTWPDPPRTANPDRHPFAWDVVLGVDAETDDWAFPRAGRYRVTAVYEDPGAADARSNTVKIEVREPEGVEADAHEALRRFRGAALAAAVNGRMMPRELEPFAARYPASVYVYLPRVYDLFERLHHAGRGVDPGSEDRARQGDVLDAARRQDLSRRYYRALMPLATELASMPGPLQPDLMLKLAGLQRALGDAASQKAMLRKVARAFPQRPAGQQARQELKRLAADERIRRELDR